ncbi:hypothetical protein PHET_08940 [Paragonimus heterotremus]|uniref:Uncharacterized protein n=1 Tax=Paragonimus heterotremus TaxID=100268 RepID=A0A8J4WF19_9TREM|nr:hypothetical protein PHET_08940 [Paragonimus heterotremus]
MLLNRNCKRPLSVHGFLHVLKGRSSIFFTGYTLIIQFTLAHCRRPSPFRYLDAREGINVKTNRTNNLEDLAGVQV